MEQEKFIWLRPIESGFERIIQQDEQKVNFQREVGAFLASAEKLYAKNPSKCLDDLDKFYTIARDGLVNSPVSDYWSLIYFRTLAELLANFTQVFRAHKSLPPSEVINKDLRDIPNMMPVKA